MSTDAVSAYNTTGTTYEPGEARLPAKNLSQQDFLKLLVAQLSAQDPMNPQSGSDFAAQMAQFSALQTSQGTQSELAKLRADQQALQANSLIGREVTLDAGQNTTTTGTVASVQMNAGTPLLMVNGTAYTLAKVLSIQPPPAPAPTAAPTADSGAN